MARQRREEILPQQPAAADLAAAAGRHGQGALVVRAGAPATQTGTRPRRLRGPILGRPASARADDRHRLCLSATPAPEGGGAGGKRWAATDRRRSRRCLRSAAPSSPSCSLRLRFLIVAPTATGGFFNTLPKCQSSANWLMLPTNRFSPATPASSPAHPYPVSLKPIQAGTSPTGLHALAINGIFQAN